MQAANDGKVTLILSPAIGPDQLPPAKAENSFAAVQYPFNILEPEALTSHVSDKAAVRYSLGSTVVQPSLPGKHHHQEHGLMRFSNRPLNALYKGELSRLASFSPHDGA